MTEWHSVKKYFNKNFFLLLSFVFLGLSVLGYENEKNHNDKVVTEGETQHENVDIEIMEKEYNAGESILEHIVDSYGWHILDYNGHSITIPLPVILWDEGKLHMFSSSRFKHGHSSYKGFHIASEGPNKGKIIKILEEDFLHGRVIEEGKNEVLPLDFSITKNVFAVFFSMILLCWIFISVANSYKKRKGMAPKGLQSFLEPLIIFIRDDIAKPAIGEKKYQKFMPYLLTLFFFIFLNNVLGLIPFFPGGANVTGNIAVTAILALFTFIITSFSANKYYWLHIINTPGVPWWLKFPIPLMPVVELIGVFTKPFVLMVRLFANITAGHIIVLGFVSLIFIFGNINIGLGYGISVVSVAFAIFMAFLELLVAFIQAYVFTLLSALYFGMAMEENH
ncbi:MAG: F0F1 ATP synthase subunit A [Bacteroidales bacterium]|nr:F0F1 ATP synthase subunit A [Bacteroidales bacterium]